MTDWNIYFFQYGSSGLVRRLIYRGLKASSEKSAIDTVCKQGQSWSAICPGGKG
jgi:hypothetical protein